MGDILCMRRMHRIDELIADPNLLHVRQKRARADTIIQIEGHPWANQVASTVSFKHFLRSEHIRYVVQRFALH